MNSFDAKGLVVFVEPRWVTGETCLFNVTNPYTYRYATNQFTNMRKNFLLKLEQEGFIITFDKHKKDVVSLIMNDEVICEPDVDVDIYKKNFDQKIFEIGGEKLNYPKSLTMEDFFKTPFFPAVLKNELMNAGIDKILIENQQQLDIIKQFYDDFKDNPEYLITFKNTIFQTYIKSPGKYKSYIRILINAAGNVMGASLKYSKSGESNNKSAKGIYETALLVEDSKYYINAQRMFNYYSSGENISFYQPKFSQEKSQILKLHGIDPSNPKIPEDILEVAKNIATKGNNILGIMCGIDFMYNELDGKWYYLEIQAFPAIDEWLSKKGQKPILVKNIDDYIKLNSIELEARHEALIECAIKKLDECEKKYVKKI